MKLLLYRLKSICVFRQRLEMLFVYWSISLLVAAPEINLTNLWPHKCKLLYIPLHVVPSKYERHINSYGLKWHTGVGLACKNKARQESHDKSFMFIRKPICIKKFFLFFFILFARTFGFCSSLYGLNVDSLPQMTKSAFYLDLFSTVIRQRHTISVHHYFEKVRKISLLFCFLYIFMLTKHEHALKSLHLAHAGSLTVIWIICANKTYIPLCH